VIFELVLFKSGYSNIKDIKLPMLVSGIPDALKHFLTAIFTWHPGISQTVTHGNLYIENTS
jgi:hypothetical protein